MTTLQRLQEAARKAVAEYKTAAQAADKAFMEGTLDAATRERLEQLKATAHTAKDEYLAAKKDAELIGGADELARKVGLPSADGGHPVSAAERSGKSLGLQVVNSEQYKDLIARYSKGRDDFGLPRIPDKARVESDPIPVSGLGLKNRRVGQKALFTGASDTSAGAFVVTDRTDIVETLGRRTLTLREVIALRRTTSDLVEYVRQTSHTNAAAPVAEATTAAGPTANLTTGALELPAGSGVKPEGSWAYSIISTPVRTIAEWVPVTKRALADVSQLEGLIDDELEADIAEAEETQIISGSGTGENLTGILSTSGIQTHAKGADTLFDAILKARTKASTIGRVRPNAVLMNPTQVEQVFMAKDAQGRYFGLGPFGMGPATLWTMPIVESEAIAAGTAIVGDFKKAVLWDREQTNITMSDSHADFFTRNLVAVLGEERVAFGVTRPAAFVSVTGL